MGTARIVSAAAASTSGWDTTIKLSPGWNAVFYWGVWAVCIVSIGIVLWSALRSKRWDRWTTQDILIDRTLMVGNNRLADSGSICVGCHCLILPPVPPGATPGPARGRDMAGIAWAE
jgi:hypothetical protein